MTKTKHNVKISIEIVFKILVALFSI